MPSFFIPARDSRHRAACLALYRALLRQVPRINLPDDLTSRPGWTNPIRFLISSGFRRNKNDTSPRLVTSALKSGYRFLSLLSCAHDASSPQHAEVVTFLRDRQNSFPPPVPARPAEPPRPPRPPPLLTKVSAPGEKPVYTSTVRPRPLSEIASGVRKVPVLDSMGIMAFLRIGKPQSHSHAVFLRRKADQRQARITALQELWEEDRTAAAEEDKWEATLEKLAWDEGVDIPDIEDEGGRFVVENSKTRQLLRCGPYEYVVRQHGVNYLTAKLDEEAADVEARATAMLDIVDREKKLSEQEKRERKERKLREWEERRRKADQGEEREPQE